MIGTSANSRTMVARSGASVTVFVGVPWRDSSTVFTSYDDMAMSPYEFTRPCRRVSSNRFVSVFDALQHFSCADTAAGEGRNLKNR